MFRKYALSLAFVVVSAFAGVAHADSMDVDVYTNGNNNDVTVIINQAPEPVRPSVQFGVYCSTQYGFFGPGMPLPVGSSCIARDPWGVLIPGIIR
jgi:hypothetical protein